MKRSAPTSSPGTDDSSGSSDTMSTWQACQARFRKSKKTSLLEDIQIDRSVLDHMQLPSTTSDNDDVYAFLPIQSASANDDSSCSSFPDDLTPASSSALPLVPLRRDHSSGGGRVYSKRQKLAAISDM